MREFGQGKSLGILNSLGEKGKVMKTRLEEISSVKKKLEIEIEAGEVN
ncbi:MAG: hypothetical protein GWN86_31245, partial [Desulfobacterales bacterium]|nr:hypothetical protein [Desulfobacterales bacterium]